ncbi:MAG TPA: hypothetical protein VHA74_00875 [Candidatus Dojkabacteria bacterium]|nr:hypothetical protein [Candidatus Dojkabacteria bacterium]
MDPKIAQIEEKPKVHWHIWLIIVIVSIIVVPLVVAFVFYTLRGNSNSQKNQDNNSGNTSNNGSNSNNNNPNQYTLDCVPRGHDNYRSEDTFVIDPTDSKIMYIAVEYKGVFKSTDSGSTWERITDGISAYPSAKGGKCYQEMGKLLIDSKNHNRLLLSRVESPGLITDPFSENAGLYLSMDGGMNWKQLVKGSMNASGSRAIGFDYDDSITIYYGTNNMAASWGGADPNKYFNTVGTLYKSLDNGNTWLELKTGIEKSLRATSLVVDNQNHNRVILGNFRVSGVENDPNLNPDQSKDLLMTEDGGNVWSNISNRMPKAAGIINILQSKNNGNNFVIVGQSIKSSDPSPLFYSNDNLQTIKQASITSIYAIAFDPTSVKGNRILAYAPFMGNKNIYESNDAGKTWKAYASFPSYIDGSKVRISNFVWDTKSKNVIYANGDNGYLLKSTDNGITWSKVISQEDLK